MPEQPEARGAGRGIAVQLGAAGATVYVTGRTTRSQQSEMNRQETIEETAALVDASGGRGIPVQVDHLVPEQVRALVTRIESEQGGLHILVNDIWGATRMEWNKTVWESDLDYGLRTLRLAVDTRATTSHFAIPLLIRRHADSSSKSPTEPTSTTRLTTGSPSSTIWPRRR